MRPRAFRFRLYLAILLLVAAVPMAVVLAIGALTADGTWIRLACLWGLAFPEVLLRPVDWLVPGAPLTSDGPLS